MLGFVKTDEELERIAAIVNPWRYLIDDVSCDFETTWEFARAVLPPCFEPVGDEQENRAVAYAGILEIDCPHFGPFDADHVGLACCFGDIEGSYLIHSVHSTDGHVHAGRDVWGGPKKFGTGRVFHDADHHFAYSERLGKRLIEIEAETTGPELAPRTSLSKAFALKMFPHTSGRGLEYPPLLNIWDCEEIAISLREGTGTLSWGRSEHDPLHTIPIVSVSGARVTKAEFYYRGFSQVQLEDPDDVYARYYWGTYMDDPTIDGIPTRWRQELETNGHAHEMLATAAEPVAR
jgi:acetoacetate decarboxylase